MGAHDSAMLSLLALTGGLGAAVSRKVLGPMTGDGYMTILLGDGSAMACDWLDTGDGGSTPGNAGDEVLVVMPADGGRPVVLGRIRSGAALPRRTVSLEAVHTLTLKCGDSSLELRADGKVVLKGDDVLIRAKGTQRIRAGNVAIN